MGDTEDCSDCSELEGSQPCEGCIPPAGYSSACAEQLMVSKHNYGCRKILPPGTSHAAVPQVVFSSTRGQQHDFIFNPSRVPQRDMAGPENGHFAPGKRMRFDDVIELV